MIKNSNKFWIKTRLIISLSFFIIIVTNIFATIIYAFVENNFFKNVKNDIEVEYINVEKYIKNNNNFVFKKIPNEIEEWINNKWLFLIIWENQKDIIENYKLWYYIYDENLVYRKDYLNYNILIWKNIKDINILKKSIKDTLFFSNIISILVVVLISYFISNRILKPLLKLSRFLNNFDISKENRLIENPYWESEIWTITNSINKFINKIKETLESQKSFIQDTSHELKTPLMQIQSNIELIEWKIEDKKIKKKLDEIKSSTENMDKIISNLSFITRWEKTFTNKEEIIISKYLKSLLLEYETQAESKNIKFEIDLKEDFILVNNYYYLDRLFGNIISNSIFYNNWNNTTKITIEKNKVTINDNWIWIDIDEINKIYDRFYRNQNSNIYNDKWNWLGLTIVKKICDNFWWDITINSEKNIWTKIELFFK